MNHWIKFKQRLIRGVFARMTEGTRQHSAVIGPGFEAVTFASRDGTRLEGWTYRWPERDCSAGTVILLHGFCDHSGSQIREAVELSSQFGLVALAFDQRMHGWSDHHIPSFGSREALDVQAAMDFADRVGLPKPYLLHGTSLGAMAAQRAGIVDPRVRGLFLLACPAWPWDAIGVCVSQCVHPLLVLCGHLVNAYYGADVLGDGDIRRHQQPLNHAPLVCYVMGKDDHYGIGKTRIVYAYWRGIGVENQFPSEISELRKWFWALPEVVHPSSAGLQLWDWPGYSRLRREFFERALRAAKV